MSAENIDFNHIKYIFFDLDDTLCDYRNAKAKALKAMSIILENRGINTSEFKALHKNTNAKLMRQYLDGNIKRDEFRIRRFLDVLDAMGEHSEDLASDLNDTFMKFGNDVELFEDVVPFLSFIENSFKTAILTNGPSDGQRKKIKGTFLDKYIGSVFISEEVGFAKPNPEYFLYVLEDLNISADQALMVGDSIENDYNGALYIGIHSLLIDRFHMNEDFKGSRITDLYKLKDLISEFVD